jgi:iron complex outermembrane receptor protein
VDLDYKRELLEAKKGALSLIQKFDFVRAKNTQDGSNLPRISPGRLTLGLEYEKEKWSLDVESIYVAHQTKVALGERRTDDYIHTNLGHTYHIVGNLFSVDLFIRVRIIFNVEARNHVSTLKEIAPLPGRNIIAGAQAQF